jgi:hypothetical protein
VYPDRLLLVGSDRMADTEIHFWAIRLLEWIV